MVQDFMSIQSKLAMSQLTSIVPTPNDMPATPIPEAEAEELPPPQDFLRINERTFEIFYNANGDQHELAFDLETFLNTDTSAIRASIEEWYRQKFLIFLRAFNEIHETAIQPEQIFPGLLKEIAHHDDTLLHLFLEIVENLGYSLKENLMETLAAITPFTRFITIVLTTKKSEFICNSRNVEDIYTAAVNKKIEIAKERFKDQYPKLFEGKSFKEYTIKDMQPLHVITIGDRTVNLYEGLHLIKTSLFVDIYDTPEEAEAATFSAFVCRLTNLLKRNIALLRYKHSESTKIITGYQYLRKIDGSKTPLEEMVKEIYRQSIATQVTISDLLKPEAKVLKPLEKYIEKEKSIPENIMRFYEHINTTAAALKRLEAFRVDIQKMGYINLLKHLLKIQTGDFFKKTSSINISTSAELTVFLSNLLKQIDTLNSPADEINDFVFKANVVKRMVDNQTNNQELKNLFQAQKQTNLSLDQYYHFEIFDCLNLPIQTALERLEKIKAEFSTLAKDLKKSSVKE